MTIYWTKCKGLITDEYMHHIAKAQKEDIPEIEKEKTKAFCFVKLPENYESDGMVMKRKGKKGFLSVIEMKKDDENLGDAVLQSALYSLLFRTRTRRGGDFLFSLIAVSLPNMKARLGNFRFRLSKGKLELENSRLVIGKVFEWNSVENAVLLVSHILCDPIRIPYEPENETPQQPPLTHILPSNRKSQRTK
eukprot:GHVP01018938.1.p1 GENE.GHVP01018938.1~~GHVP01018938.1.p1  ORF type:complete len:192 (+),score=25.13 GHVP01018938.1:142-717(+)